MKTAAAFVLAAANLVAGHATFQSFVIGGKDQGQHFAVRTPSNSNNPIKDVTSPLMTCNGGTAKAGEYVEVDAKSSVTFQWHHNDGASTAGDADEPIAASHKGPIMVYIAPYTSNGEGAVWTKIHEEGLSNGKWAVDNFIANKGAITIDLPDLAAGDYLIRPEIIALHEADRQGGAQFYNGCGQLRVKNSAAGATLPATGTDMTKAYSATDPGVLVSIYGGITTYQIPGPKVWDGVSSGTSPAPSKPSASATPMSSAAPVKPTKTATPVVSSTPVATPTKGAQPTPTPTKGATQPAPTTDSGYPTYPAPSTTPSTGTTLPKTFTIEQFITWLKATTSSSKARRHARSFQL